MVHVGARRDNPACDLGEILLKEQSKIDALAEPALHLSQGAQREQRVTTHFKEHVVAPEWSGRLDQAGPDLGDRRLGIIRGGLALPRCFGFHRGIAR